jgi:hypothetical protein
MIDMPLNARYAPVDEDRRQVMAGPQRPGASPCPHFAQACRCACGEACEHDHPPGLAVLANLLESASRRRTS